VEEDIDEGDDDISQQHSDKRLEPTFESEISTRAEKDSQTANHQDETHDWIEIHDERRTHNEKADNGQTKADKGETSSDVFFLDVAHCT
jgi:hypothetical protein